jgi:hypothetical protein
VRPRHHYEVFWSEEFWFDEKSQRKTFGITRTYSDKKNYQDQIVLNNKQSDKETVHTYFHEFIHCLSEHYGANLTETQVENLELSFSYMMEFFLTLNGHKRTIKKRGKK